MKRCGRCKSEKILEDFSNNKSSKDGKHHTCRACKSNEQKSRHNRSRHELFVRYSKDGVVKCQCPGCNVDDEMFLTIDHINDDGASHRSKIGNGMWSFYWWAKRNGFPDGFQVLCYNCNCGRSRNGGICPHLTP